MGIAPVIWASISDHYHVRRCLMIIFMLIFAVASLGSVLIINIWGLVVLRCVQSFGSSCSQSVGAGIITDCYRLEQRGTAFAKYFFGVFAGALIGPIIGGVLIMSDEGWRTTFWFCLVMGGSIALILFFLLPEMYRADLTLPSLKTENPTEEEKKETPRMNPLPPFLLLRHLFVLLASLGGGIAFGSVFAVETIIPPLYEEKYGFNSWKIGAGIGSLMGSIVDGHLSDLLLIRARKQRGRAMVKDRLTLNIWAAMLLFIPFGLLLFGWMTEFNQSVWASIVGFGCFNFGMTQVMASTSAYLVDATPSIGASVSAAAKLVRMVIAFVLALSVNSMVVAIVPGYTTVFLAALAWAAIFLLLILKVYGERLRHASGLMD
ncbi:major facilitator superfamily domain-containing protein [Chlamydoabsidia padenii]|nr:major facilitator superfamily domain-containing protein [Chlamydoabsidia padenii]